MRTRRLSIWAYAHTVADLLGLTMPFVDPAVLCPPAAGHGKKKRVLTEDQKAHKKQKDLELRLAKTAAYEQLPDVKAALVDAKKEVERLSARVRDLEKENASLNAHINSPPMQRKQEEFFDAVRCLGGGGAEGSAVRRGEEAADAAARGGDEAASGAASGEGEGACA